MRIKTKNAKLVYRMNLSNMTSHKMAEKLSVHPTTISTWINYTHLPTDSNIEKMEKLFRCTKEELGFEEYPQDEENSNAED